MLSDGYARWLALSPQGKYPVRPGDAADPERFARQWAGLRSGVERKAPLRRFYSAASIESLGEGVRSFRRWGFEQGEAALLGALRGPQPIPKALAAAISGRIDAAEAARRAQAAVEKLSAASASGPTASARCASEYLTPCSATTSARRSRPSATPWSRRCERRDDPDGFWARKASDLGVAAGRRAGRRRHPDPAVRGGLVQLLDVLDQQGLTRAPSQLSREQILRNIALGLASPRRGPRRAAGHHAVPLLRRARPADRHEPELGDVRLRGPAVAAA